MTTSSPNNESVNDEKQLIVASALSAFDARLKQLERPEEKSRLANVQKNASLVALIVGIILSTVSLFDVFWSKPRDDVLRNLEEFNKTVNSVASLRQNLIQLQYQSNNSQMIFALSSMVTPQVLANIQYATALLPKIGDHAGIPQLIILIGEAINIYDWKSAGILVDKAMAIKNATPALQSEARRYKARLMFLTGKTEAGRTGYTQALDVLSNETGFGINGPRAYIVSEWILSEFAFGDCGLGNKKIKEFIKLLEHPQIITNVRKTFVMSLKIQLEQIEVTGKQRCPIPDDLEALFWR